MVWPGGTADTSGGTNTAAALAVARRMRERTDSAAPGVVIVVTDGPPSSGRLASTEVQLLAEQGTRVLFMSVGAGIPTQTLKQWVSWPTAENLVEVSSFASMDYDKTTELLADICPVLGFNPE